MPIRLVVADDHPLILEALQQLFSLEPDFELVACCRNGAETLQAIKTHQPDMLILDVRMPGQGIHVKRDTQLSIAYSEELIFSMSVTLQSTDRHHGIVG